jgi:hypothetical protein
MPVITVRLNGFGNFMVHLLIYQVYRS